MFATSRKIGLFERYRIPYAATAETRDHLLTIGRAGGDGPRLLSLGPGTPAAESSYLVDGCLLHVALASQPAIDAALREGGQTWEEELPILDLSGTRQASIYRADDGSVLVPFDLDAPLDALFEEAYLPSGGGRLNVLARRAYYRARPLIPRQAQLAMRRRFRSHQERAVFPAFPTETSLHRLEALLLRFVEEIAGEPVPWLSSWPAPFDWSLVLTHDVERSAGYQHIDAVRAAEERHALRSAWYFVPERDYRVEESVLDGLRGTGCEICVHGLRHDGRDLSPGVFQKRLPAMQAYAERWGARGFRSPATHRDRELVQALGVEHDSSWCDVARYEPQPGGTCSWLPFFIGEVVELPITLPMDHTIFEVLGETTEASWLEKTAFLRKYGGMALMLTHPDYLLDPERLLAYDRFIGIQAGDQAVWHALPHEVADWWRERGDTHLGRSAGAWTAIGPAASRAQVRLGTPDAPPAISR
jgi:hypothetical protein